ncbi:MAG TPA: biopolymer transporter ExbD [Gemmatimonadaceae bacterium]|nr:biopolymer transporter ExbD [Gemmatimonadaceae bacterium]
MKPPTAAANSEINVTPFLDILLVLLVIFLASLKARRAIEVQLPVPTSESCTACEAIVLEVRRGDRYALNQAEFDRAELSHRLRIAFEGRPTSILFVKGAADVRYQEVLSAMDSARGAGVKVLAIAPTALR